MDQREYHFFQNVQSILLEPFFFFCTMEWAHPCAKGHYIPMFPAHISMCTFVLFFQVTSSTASSLCLPTLMNIIIIFCIGNFTEAILSSLNSELQHHPTERSVKRTVSTPADKAPPHTEEHAPTTDLRLIKTAENPTPLLHLLSSYGGMHR